jgi:hypothetical protein
MLRFERKVARIDGNLSRNLRKSIDAQQSTGPKTDGGKAASRLNAIKHGMTSSMVVLPNEDAAWRESFRTMTLESLRPHGEDEQILAVSMAEHKWRIRRLSRIETASYVGAEGSPAYLLRSAPMMSLRP